MTGDTEQSERSVHLDRTGQQTTGPTTSIRRADLSDVGEMHAIGIEVTASTYCPINDEYASLKVRTEWSIQALQDSLERYPYWVSVDENGAILGVANLGEHDGESVLGKLFVRPQAQGRGIGSQLLAAVMEAADGPDLSLEYVDGNTSAAAFCRDHGFEEVRRTTSSEGLPDMVRMRRTR